MPFLLKSPPPDKCLRSLPRELMERYGVFPVELDEETNRLTVAMSDVYDFDLIADLQLAAGMADGGQYNGEMQGGKPHGKGKTTLCLTPSPYAKDLTSPSAELLSYASLMRGASLLMP